MAKVFFSYSHDDEQYRDQLENTWHRYAMKGSSNHGTTGEFWLDSILEMK